jgi:hypothetical protein
MNSSNSLERILRQDATQGTSTQTGIVWLAEGFGFDAVSGEWFTANVTALAALEWQRAGLQRRQIIDRMTEQFEVSAATAERDLQVFFAALPDAFGVPSSH